MLRRRGRVLRSTGTGSKTATVTCVREVGAGELRNHVSAVLRRVEGGERLRVTVSGRPVAELSPLPTKPSTMRWEDFQQGLEGERADAGLSAELASLVPDTTDDAGPK